MLLEKKGWKRCVCVVSEQLSDDGGMFCVYVYMSVYICVYIYVRVCMYACVCVCACVCVHECLGSFIICCHDLHA